jgi:hypothetical protein
MTQTKESSHTEIQTSDSRPPTSVSLSHHQRRCGICRHPDRHWIEEDILHWRSYFDIEKDYDLKDRSSIYRHARAFDLFALRKRNLRSALELVIERAGDIRPSAVGLVSVIRAYTCLTDDGRWIDRPKHAIIAHVTAPADPGIGYTPPRENLPDDASGGGRTQPIIGDTRDHEKALPQAAPPGQPLKPLRMFPSRNWLRRTLLRASRTHQVARTPSQTWLWPSARRRLNWPNAKSARLIVPAHYTDETKFAPTH